jgi:hypothetical protein
MRMLSLPSDATTTPEPVTTPKPVRTETNPEQDGMVILTPADELFENEYLAGGTDDMGSWDMPSILTLLFGET